MPNWQVIDDYGEPEGTDFMSIQEEQVRRASRQRVKDIEEGAAFLGRQMGSKLSDTKTQQETFQRQNADPNELMMAVAGPAKTVGPMRALYELAKWRAAMRGGTASKSKQNPEQGGY